MTRDEILAEKKRLAKIEESLNIQEFAEVTLPNCRALIGKCFAYRRNSYSCPSKPSDYWGCFRRIMDCIEDPDGCACYLVFEAIQIDSKGSASISTGNEFIYGQRLGFPVGWNACLFSEYIKNRGRVAQEVANPRSMIKKLRTKKTSA